MNFFNNRNNNNSIFFDEGPIIIQKAIVAVNTSSIETTEIDAYRQGVNLTQQKHFDAGTIKIHAGEPGHVLRKNGFGMDRNNITQDSFFEVDYFDPVAFLRAQSDANSDFFDTLMYPIITGDNDQIENYHLNGIIEPMPIREIASFFSIEAPFSSRGMKASLMAGNIDLRFASDRILTVDTFSSKNLSGAFLDLIDMFGNNSTIGYFNDNFEPLQPFVDARKSVVTTTQQDQNIISVLSLMTGSTENYISPEQKSQTAGWDFSNNNFPGTDSIAFGGMTY